jgi:hypothetical protein
MRSSRRSTIIAAAAALWCTVAVSACAGPAGDPNPRGELNTPVPALSVGYDCTAPNILEALGLPVTRGDVDTADAPAPMRLPEDFVPVSVYRCSIPSPKSIGPDIGGVITAERLDGDLAALLNVLSQPDSDAADGASGSGELLCDLSFQFVPQLWLMDEGGRSIRVRWPTNACGKTLAGSVEVLDSFVATRVKAKSP